MKIDSAYYTKHKDTIILQFLTEKYDADEMNEIFKMTQGLFPDNDILCLPADISISILREENPFL